MKHLLQNKEFQLDEILFQGRNKNYGAYILRQDSDRILTKSMFVGIALFGLIAATPFAVNAMKGNIASKPPIEVVFDFIPPDDIPEIIKPPQVSVPPQSDVKTVDTQVPEPKRGAIKDKAPATVTERENVVSGFENKGTEEVKVNYNPPSVPTFQGPPSVPQSPPTVIPKVPDNVIVTKVDEEAVFKGGIEAFRSKVIQSFDTSNFDGMGEKISTTITFIVEKDGTISGIQSNGKDSSFNKEAEKTIKKVKGSWTPAKVKGEPVRSYFRFPISMMFE